jgi:hypothetical protein
VDIDAITAKVKQGFAVKKAKKTAHAAERPAKKTAA